MIAVTLTSPEKLEITAKERKTPGPNDVLVRVRAAGIGGTDLRIFKGIVAARLPLVLGQEFAGIVEEVGNGVSAFSKGDRVAIEPIVRDNSCEYCKEGMYSLCNNLKVLGIHLDGGYSEWVSVPQYTLHKMPDNIAFEEAALIVPASVAYYAVSRAEQSDGLSFAIIGAGPIGLSAIQCAKLSGASGILLVDPLEVRRNLAKRLGASTIIDATPSGFTAAVNEMTKGSGVDVVIEATGNPDSVDMALGAVKKGGRVIFTGAFGKPATVNMTNIVRKDLIVKGSWLYPNMFSKVLQLAGEAKINLKDYISHRFKLSEADTAFRAAQDPSATKVIMLN